MTNPGDHRADITLFDTGAGATHALTVDAVPAAVGRWQPVRAGVVNSWAWVDEQFLFCNGWSALVGPNGSGKSLTSAQWFPTMIDGDTRTSALSMAQRGAGNLADRHHNRTPGREKTGAWWLEFGFRTPEGDLRWMTLGLWIRWRGQKSDGLERAWFITPARVGADLHLHADGAPIDIDGLCQQLATCEGQIFTSQDRLQRAASRHGAAVNDEAAYADAVRVELFPGTDRDQMTALTTVLRALRSVRVNDRMTPDEMHATLTSALPALSTEYVELLAKNLAQSNDLLEKVNNAKREHDLLNKLSRAYGRYADTAAGATAHALLAAHDDVQRVEHATGKLARDTADHQRRLSQATQAKRDAEQRLEELRITGELLRRRTEGHPGSHLPELAAAVEAAHKTAELAAATAAERRGEADDARGEERKASEAFDKAARHLTGVMALLRDHATQVSAEAFCEPFQTTTDAVAADLAQPHAIGEADLSGLAEPVKTWLHHRDTVIGQVRTAIAHLAVCEGIEAQASTRHASAVDELSAAERELGARQEQVTGQHEEALQALRAFSEQHGPVLGPVPVQLIASIPIQPDTVTTWADQALEGALHRIDLEGATARHDKAQEAATSAAERLAEAQQATAAAATGVQSATTALKETISRLPSPPQDATRWTNALDAIDIGSDSSFNALPHCDAAMQEATNRGESLRQAANALATARQLNARAGTDTSVTQEAAEQMARTGERHTQQLASCDDAVAAFVQQVAEWAASLQVLILEPHELPQEADARDGDLHSFRASIATVARPRTEAPLREELETARREARNLEGQLRALDERITHAETEELPPEAPSWRADRTGRTGAPLWALVDFAPHLSDRARAIVEGALLTAGILDAWVDPEADAIAGDVLLKPGRPARGRSLADVLIAQPTDTINAEQITSILRQIGYAADHSPGGVAFVGEQLRTEWATAMAPAAWQPQYIGATTRAEQRQRLLERLRRQRTQLALDVQTAQVAESAVNGRIATLVREAVLPDFTDLLNQRAALAETQTALTVATAAHESAAVRARESHDEAQAADSRAAEACQRAGAPTDSGIVAAAVTACAKLVQQLQASRSQAEILAQTLADRAGRVERKTLADKAAATAREAAKQARRHDEHARRSRQAVPPLHDLREAIAQVQEAETLFEQASAVEAAARSDLERCRADTGEARRRRTAAATTKDGRRLPLEEPDLKEFNAAVNRFAKCIESWVGAAARLILVRDQAQAARAAATAASQRAATAIEKEEETTAHAKAEQHKLNEERRLHEHTFQQLLDDYERNGAEQQEAKTQSAKHDADARASEKQLAKLEERATTLAAELERARESCAETYDRLLELFDHGLIADVTDGPSYERPTDLAAATAVAKRLAPSVPAQSVREHLQRESARLVNELRPVAEVFIRMGRHVSEEEFGTGRLRRIVLTDSDTSLDAAAPARPLRQAVADISRRLDGLQRDYDDQLRTEIKGSMFTQLRAQIVARIDLAKQIVAAIDATLKGVRTGVERVGVRLAWEERHDDPIALEALRYIQAANVDGNFDDMYEFFIARLADEDKTESASERIARVFDYRTWFAWRVEVTHKAFSDEAHPDEVFREITKRKNPLDTLSTGEKRLASMLPLLAAVKSFYSTPGFIGPRMAFIDELDAALDQTNMRTLLALLRNWDLDVLATLPTMGKLLVPQLETTAIHKIIRSGSGARFSVPYVWRGAGLPEAVRISIPGQAAPRAADPSGDAP